jgi:4-hydroxybutyrate CoA-transferase
MGEEMRDKYQKKLLTPAMVADSIQSGDRILVSGGAMQPLQFLAALSTRRELRRVELFTAMTLVPPDLLVRQFVAAARGEVAEREVRWTTFCPGPGTREGVVSGVVDYVPLNLQSLGELLARRSFDVMVIGSSGMDQEGNFNLGTNVDWMADVLANATLDETLVIAEVNPELPRTAGPVRFHLDMVDRIIEAPRQPIVMPSGDLRPEAKAIGGFLTSLVPDGATLHLGLGELVAQAASFLDGKRDLGLHSDLISDVALFLHERGALTGRRKRVMEGRWVGSYVLGSRKLYEFVNDNENVVLHPCEFVARPANIVRNGTSASITQAICVDLSGQVVGQSAAMEFGDHPGVQRAFHVAAASTVGGAGIVVLPTPGSARSSNIVGSLPPHCTVAIPREEVDTVVTEYGIARLRNKTLSQRALALISVAHPQWRESLARQAQAAGLL